jgi:V/A-type H+-transporting ATPase subunit F
LEYFFLGDDELVTAFRLIGINGLTVRDADDAVEIFMKITRESQGASSTSGVLEAAATVGCHVLIITEETAVWLGEYLIDWQLSGLYPLIVEIPGISGRLEGRKSLVDSIREAIGIHV